MKNEIKQNDSSDFHSDKKIVCVTGANGFIGRKLVERLNTYGWVIRVLTRVTDRKFPSNIEIFVGDLIDSDFDLQDFLKDADMLFHCAGETKNKQKMSSLHIDGTQKLIISAKQAIARSAKVFHWIQLSSCGAYGPPSKGNIESFREILETTTTAPDNEYEKTKTRSDELLVAASDEHLVYTILRPSNVVGPSMKHHSFRTFIKWVSSGYFFHIGRKDAIATYVHVNDVVNAMVLIAMDPKSRGEIYNLSSDCNWVDLVKEMAIVLNTKILPIRISYKIVSPTLSFIKFFVGRFVHVPQLSAFALRTSYPINKIESQLGYKLNKKFPESIGELTQELMASKSDNL